MQRLIVAIKLWNNQEKNGKNVLKKKQKNHLKFGFTALNVYFMSEMFF